MTNEKAIDLLRRMQEPEAYEPQITEEAFEALELAIRVLGTDKNVGTTDVPDINIGELISRQAAINALREYMVGKRCNTDGTMMARLIEDQVINKPPTIQPKIIRCMECMHYEASITGNPWGVCCHKDWIANNIGHNVDENGWCYRAERRETNAKLD